MSGVPIGGEGEALFGSDYSPDTHYEDVWDILAVIMDATTDIDRIWTDAQIAALVSIVEASCLEADLAAESETSPDSDLEGFSRTWWAFFWDAGWGGLQVAGGVGEMVGGSAIAVGGSVGSSGTLSIPSITSGVALTIKGGDDAYAGVRQILGDSDATPYWEQGVRHVVGEELALPATLVIDTITGKPTNLLKDVAEDTTLGAAQRSAKSARKGDTLLTPIDPVTNKTRSEFIKLKGSQGWKNRETGEIWQKSDSAHYGNGEWKVGIDGAPPEKKRKITVDAKGRFIKKQE